MKKILIIFLISLFLFPKSALAKIGVGVGVGKIEVDEVLVPGAIYDLPNVSVINTGDVETVYEVGVAYNEIQEELKPGESWLIFNPKTVTIKPQEAKEIDLKLNLPMKMEPGLYFAYVEVKPKIEKEEGVTNVGIAAATKLSFAVAPANLGAAIYYKAKSVLGVYAPWPQRILIVIGLVIVILSFKKFFKLEVNVKKKDKGNE